MASAFRDGRGRWIADFRPIHATGKTRRRVQVPSDSVDPWAFAKECEALCRKIEEQAPKGILLRETIRRARELKAVTSEQAANLERGMIALPTPKGYERPTILSVASSHPASKRQESKNWKDVLRYHKHVKEFCEEMGLKYLDELTLAHVTAWIAKMQERGEPWDTRRHKLMWVRRACAMMPTHGLPDVIGRMKLDHKEDDSGARGGVEDGDDELGIGAAVRWLEPKQIKKLLVAASKESDPRIAAALALQLCMGLRPSEVTRLAVGDVVDGALLVGMRKGFRVKNKASRRALAIPKAILPWLVAAASGRDSSAYLIPSTSGGVRFFRADQFGPWLSRWMKSALGAPVQTKMLRKSFSTWAWRDLRILPEFVESYLGHKHKAIAAVSADHYMGPAQVRHLLPTADIISKAVLATLGKGRVSTKVSTKRAKPTGRRLQKAS